MIEFLESNISYTNNDNQGFASKGQVHSSWGRIWALAIPRLILYFLDLSLIILVKSFLVKQKNMYSSSRKFLWNAYADLAMGKFAWLPV